MMTTKEQERKALEQIRKIVEGLGEDSYIATAFEGCFEIAQDNIENDFACSLQQRLERAESTKDELRERCYEMQNELKEAQEALRREKDQTSRAWDRVNELNDQLADACKDIGKWIDEIEEQKKALAEKDLTIITLKAKLYDLIVK